MQPCGKPRIATPPPPPHAPPGGPGLWKRGGGAFKKEEREGSKGPGLSTQDGPVLPSSSGTASFLV